MFLGLTLIFLAWEGGWQVGRIALASCGWVLAALLPTLAVVGWYAAHGYLDELLFANVRSIGMRGSVDRSEEHTSELQSLMRISYAVFCLKKKTEQRTPHRNTRPLQPLTHTKSEIPT